MQMLAILVLGLLLLAKTWVGSGEEDSRHSCDINVSISISIHSYGQRHQVAASNLQSMLQIILQDSTLQSLPISDIKFYNDSLCDRNAGSTGNRHLAILITPTQCQSYPHNYILYHLHDDDFFPQAISHEDPYLFSSHIRLKDETYGHEEIGISSGVYQRAIALWTSDEDRVEYLSQLSHSAPGVVRFVPMLRPHELSVGHHLKKLSAAISSAIEAADLETLLQDEDMKDIDICSTPSSTCHNQRMSSSTSIHSVPYGCMEPGCTYTCGAGSQAPQMMGNHKLRSQQGKRSISCDEEVCQIIARTVAPTFHQWTIPPPLECPSGVVGSSIGKYSSAESFKLYPIGFVSPPSDISSCVPEKVHDFSAVDPADRSSYIYGIRDQSEYKRNMAHSRFSYTRKKAGWDAQRHFEIMATGTVPYFEAIDSVPERVIPFMPKEILTAAKKFADSSASTFDSLSRPKKFGPSFNHSAYNEIACCVLSHAKKHQTSIALADYVLKVTRYHQYNIDEVRRDHVKNVLVLCGSPPEFDYMVASLLHGLREILGDTAVTDFPSNPIYYEIQPDVFQTYSLLHSTYVHGLGYTWGHRLRNNTNFHNSLNRADIRKGILQKRWDLIVYPQVHRGMPYWDLVKASYNRGEIILIDAEDWSAGKNLLVEFLHHQGEENMPLQWPPLNSDWRALFHQGIYFKRELDTCPDNSNQYYSKFVQT